jgi:hypothetical protein
VATAFCQLIFAVICSLHLRLPCRSMPQRQQISQSMTAVAVGLSLSLSVGSGLLFLQLLYYVQKL